MRRTSILLSLAALALGLQVPSASAEPFGLQNFDVTFTEAPPAGSAAGTPGSADPLAGTHPFEMTTSFDFPLEGSAGSFRLSEPPKDIDLTQIAGFIGNPDTVPRCSAADFLTSHANPEGIPAPSCSDSAAVGVVGNELVDHASGNEAPLWSAVFNLVPPPGSVAEFGFWVAQVPITVTASLSESPPYDVVAHVRNISQVLEVGGSRFTLWGIPADPIHDPIRGNCVHGKSQLPTSAGNCPAGIAEVPFLTLPSACKGPLATTFATDSWTNPGARLPNGDPDLADPHWITGQALTHDSAEPPAPQGLIACSKTGFSPETSAQPTAKAASSPTGLDFSLDQAHNEGLMNPKEGAISDALVEKAVVTLPEGMTINASQAEGLEVCTEAQLNEMTAFTGAGTGCPQASKIGSIEAETPVLQGKLLKGSLFVAEPYANPFNTLIALYIVVQNPELGVKVVQPLKVEPDPVTGQLVTTAEDIISQPLSHFRLHFREGTRSPLVTPPACGSYGVKALLYPSSGGAPVTSTSSFEIISGPNEGPCPKGGTPPFEPGFEAGAINNNAGSYSPFNMRLTRKDGDQDLTKFSAKLPPGMIGKLAGTTQCPASAIAQARSRTGKGGGTLEREHPSCPSSSQIGRVLAGAGVGPTPTYVPGKIYLAGPYKGAPLSVVAIVPAVAGPFDAGTVITQEALRINPLTAEVEADGSSSDPIPHILQGIPLNVRDIRVYIDKPDFTLNPTSCEESATKATLWSGGTNVFSALDDSAHSLQARFQAANCANLGFKPRLSLKLKGGTKRGGHPALTGTYAPRAGDANLKSLVLRLPRSAFLDQGHIRTICTRVQFAANGGNGGGCPTAAIYGKATAYTPLLEAPLEGPVYLRSSNHNLPDFVAALHGLVDVEAVARIDSKNGGIRASFESVPDAPLSKVVVQMQGAKKGLIVNSTDLCAAKHKANAEYVGHNGKRFSAKPVVEASCGGKRKHKKHHN